MSRPNLWGGFSRRLLRLSIQLATAMPVARMICRRFNRFERRLNFNRTAAIVMAMSGVQQDKPIRGRGTEHNPTNRFERLAVLPDPDAQLPECEQIQPRTQFFRDSTKSVIAYNSSP